MRVTLQTLLASLALVGMPALAATAVAADPVPTPAGPLEIIDNGSYDTVLRLNGETLLHDQESMTVFLEAGTADNGLLVLGFNPGGNACGALYRILDTRAGRPVMSDVFGTCSDLPEVSVSGAALTVTFPGDALAGQPVYIWENGALREDIRQPLGAPGPADFSALRETAGDHPAVLLDDPGVAQRLKAQWGDAVSEFTDRLAVGSGTALVDDRYVVGHACMARACTLEEAFIAVDTQGHEVYTMVMSDGGSYMVRPAAGSWPEAVSRATATWQSAAPDILDAIMESEADAREYGQSMKKQ